MFLFLEKKNLEGSIIFKKKIKYLKCISSSHFFCQYLSWENALYAEL